MALAAIPATVLDKLRKLSFNFLWSGCSDHSRQHLCNWETLAKPKRKGGWGIRNLSHSNQALAANTLWRALTHTGIWHSVLKDKYMPYVSVDSWLRTTCPLQDRPHLLEKYYKIVSWISNSLCWNPGSGHSIILGKDRMLEWNKLTPLPSTDLLLKF
jgi:hypothetical protein